jgi:hypothetical protein
MNQRDEEFPKLSKTNPELHKFISVVILNSSYRHIFKEQMLKKIMKLKYKDKLITRDQILDVMDDLCFDD